jgi:hypothetical protein
MMDLNKHPHVKSFWEFLLKAWHFPDPIAGLFPSLFKVIFTYILAAGFWRLFVYGLLSYFWPQTSAGFFKIVADLLQIGERPNFLFFWIVYRLPVLPGGPASLGFWATTLTVAIILWPIGYAMARYSNNMLMRYVGSGLFQMGLILFIGAAFSRF